MDIIKRILSRIRPKPPEEDMPLIPPLPRSIDEPMENTGAAAAGEPVEKKPGRKTVFDLPPMAPAIFYVIGVSCLLAMGSLAIIAGEDAVRRRATNEDEKILIKYSSDRHVGSPVRYADITQIPLHVPGLKWISPVFRLDGYIFWKGVEINATMAGVTGDFFRINRLEAVSGRLLRDLDHQMNYCVLGAKVFAMMEESNASSPRPGNSIALNGVPFTILGVMNEADSEGSQFADRMVIIHEEALERITDNWTEGFIQATAFQGIETGPVAFGIKNELMKQLFDTPVTVFHGDEIRTQLNLRMKTNMALLGAVGAVTLLIGIMGLVSSLIARVNRRKEEIAVRSLYGEHGVELVARYGWSGLLWGVFGGLLGLAGGIWLSWTASQLAGWQYIFPMDAVEFGVIITFGASVLFAFYPAAYAAELDLAAYLRAAYESREA
ncbi:MAG: ABC transporter permease [Nitrospinota bacterium]|nr:ABC transporter permease [Nitrospinota bacterium]